MAAQTVRLNGAEGFEGDAGTVVTVAALDALAAVAADPAPAPAPAPAFAAAALAAAAPPPATAPVRVEVGALKLSAAVHKRQEVGFIWVEVDVPGMAEGELAKTAQKRKGAAGGAIDFAFKHAMEIPRGRPTASGSRREWIRPTRRRPTSTSRSRPSRRAAPNPTWRRAT